MGELRSIEFVFSFQYVAEYRSLDFLLHVESDNGRFQPLPAFLIGKRSKSGVRALCMFNLVLDGLVFHNYW